VKEVTYGKVLVKKKGLKLQGKLLTIHLEDILKEKERFKTFLL